MQAKHCPNMALIWSQKVDTIEMLQRPYLPSLKNLRALAGLKGMLGPMVPNCPKWPRHGLNIAPVIQHSVGLSQDFSQILKHLKQVEANIQ